MCSTRFRPTTFDESVHSMFNFNDFIRYISCNRSKLFVLRVSFTCIGTKLYLQKPLLQKYCMHHLENLLARLGLRRVNKQMGMSLRVSEIDLVTTKVESDNSSGQEPRLTIWNCWILLNFFYSCVGFPFTVRVSVLWLRSTLIRQCPMKIGFGTADELCVIDLVSL